MLKKRANKIEIFLNKYKFKFLLLLTVFFLIIEVVLKFPYLNLLTFGFEWRLFIFYTLFLLILRPSYNYLIISSIIFLILSQFGEVMGFLIFISLFMACFKRINNKKNKYV